MVCGPTREAEARARILLRLHGSLPTAFRQALHDWQKWTGRADVTLTLLDCAAKGERLGHSCSAGMRGRASVPRPTRRGTGRCAPRENPRAPPAVALCRPRVDADGHHRSRPAEIATASRGARPLHAKRIVIPSRSWRSRESVRGGAECCRGPQRPVPVRQGEAVQAMSRARSPARASQINPGIGGHRPEDTSRSDG